METAHAYRRCVSRFDFVSKFYNIHAAAMPHRTTQDVIWASDFGVS